VRAHPPKLHSTHWRAPFVVASAQPHTRSLAIATMARAAFVAILALSAFAVVFATTDDGERF
jgi:hypothetical protein